MGLASSGDEFCFRTDKALSGIDGVKKLVDDVLIFATDYDQLLERICNVFARCQEWGISLSKNKFQLGDTVKFAGYVISSEGTKSCPTKTEALSKFTVPKNLTDLRSFMGLANQFAEFAPDLKHVMLPLQGLLSKKNAWVWTPEHEKAVQLVKNILTDPNGTVLKHFDPSLPVQLLTDASKTGIGFIILQKDQNGNNRLITCGSRFLSAAEKNYAVIELETLAITWAVLKSRLYLIGKTFEILTDHKPLLGIINGKNIDAINNSRIQRMLSKLLGYTYTINWVPGKNHVIADALSRSPVFQPEENTDILVRSIQIHQEQHDPALDFLTTAASNDPDYQKVIQVLKDQKNLKDLPKDHAALNYKSIWDSLSFDENYKLLLYHDRIIVPVQARSRILEILHIQHTGIEKTLRNARQLYFWPKMQKDISNLVSKCQECTRLLPSQASQPQIQTFASRPFEHVSVDLGYQHGTHYLILADRYSGWPTAKPLRKLDTKAVTSLLENIFYDFGKPVRIRSDGGPQFREEFKTWCSENNMIHELSSAHHHQSNGHAESAVKEMKHLLEKTNNFNDFQKALHKYRNTPRYDGLSPTQWMFGRRMRSEAPALPSAYERIDDSTIQLHESRRKEEMEKKKLIADKSSKPLSLLEVGDTVLIQDPISKRWDSSALVVHRRNERSYKVRTSNGKYYLRNRKFLRPKFEPSSDGTSLIKPVPAPMILKPANDIFLSGANNNSLSGPVRRSPRNHRVSFQ